MTRTLNAYAGTTPWGRSGIEVPKGTSPKDMLKASGLDWKVEKRELAVKTSKGFEPIAKKFGLVRADNDQVLSIVGQGYKPLQNSDAVDFFTDFVNAGDLEMKAIGSVRGGEYVWALAKAGESYNIGSAKQGDGMSNYVLLTSPHVGGKSARAQFIATREWCWNTISLALSSGGAKGSLDGRAFRMPHSQVFGKELREKATQALGLAIQRGESIKQIGNKLAKVELTAAKTTKLFYKLLKVEQPTLDAIKSGDAKVPLMIQRFEDALQKAPGAQASTAQGTAWGWLNAVTYVVDHEQGRTDDGRLYSAWFGQGASMKKHALELALEEAK